MSPPTVSATSLPKTCAQTMVIASDCVGFTLPGMIEEPGSFSGIVISPRPERGPEASQRTSLAIFMSAAASVLSAPWAATSASCAASASNLLGAVTNGRPVSSRDLGGDLVPRTPPVRVEARADRRAAERELVEVGQRGFDVREAVVELGDPAGELLAERERHRVLQVRAADLDDARELLGLRVERVAQLPHGGDQPVRGSARPAAMCIAVGKVSFDDCDMLTSSFGWTGFFAAERAARQLDRAVGDDLVDVHVGLRAAAGLPDRRAGSGRRACRR